LSANLSTGLMMTIPKRSILDHSPVDIFGDVEKFFMLAQPELLQAPDRRPEVHAIKLARFLIDQEVNVELFRDLDRLEQGAFSREITARVLDNIIDSIYVLAWSAVLLNLPFNPAWRAVQIANMKKFPTCEICNGKGCERPEIETGRAFNYQGEEITINVRCMGGRWVARNAANGKVIKPNGWQEPEIFNILHEHWKELETQRVHAETEHPEILVEAERRK
jgi:hypothetical protein